MDDMALSEEKHNAFEWSMIDEEAEHVQLLQDFRKKNNVCINNDDNEAGSP